MPRSCSSFIQSLVAWRAALRPLTEPAIWIAPPNSSSFSVRVVLPASGCEMIAKVRRRAASFETSGMAIRAVLAPEWMRKPQIIRLFPGRPRIAEAQDAAGSEHVERDRFQPHAAVGLDHEVQVRAAAEAGAARKPQPLAAPDPLAGTHGHAVGIQVRVQRHGAVVMQQAHEV